MTLKGAAAPGALALFAAALFALVIGMVGPADQGARLSAASPVFPRLAVEVTSDGDPDLEARRAGAARSMIARFDDIVLLSSQTPLEPDYRLVLAFEESADGAALTARLEQVDLGVIAWTQRFEPQSDRVDDRDGLGRVLSPLLSPYGVLFAEVAGRAEDDVGFACVARAYQYFDDESRSRRIAAQGCLAELIASGVEHPTLYALQSWLHLDSHRLSDPIAADDGDPLAAAIDDAQSAVRANPGSARAHQALLDVMKVAGNHGTAEEAARRAMAANPFDLDVMTDYGAYLVSRGDFARAKPIMEKAHELSLRSPAWFDAYRALLYWGLQDRRAASEAIAAIRPGRSAIGDVMVSVLAHERGDRGLRSEALASLLAKEPAFADNPLARILRRGFAPRFAERLARALKRAMDADGAELGVADDAAD